jgi:enamine deaminase RidA (YjgF/YER057c/UK114 family)
LPATRTTAFSPPHLQFTGMSQVVRAGDIAFVSGQVALSADGELVAPGDVQGQAEQCFRNLAESLRGVGMEMSDVVKLNCILADAGHYEAYAAAKKRFLVDAVPAATTVIARLLDDRFCMELEAVAARSSS